MYGSSNNASYKINILISLCVLFIIPDKVLNASQLYPVNINGKYGLIDRTGNIIVDAIYDGITNFNYNGHAIVKSSGKRGIINTNGQLIIPPIYDDIKFMSEEIIPVKVGEKWGFINTKGHTIIDPLYLDVGEFKDGVAPVRLSKYGFVDDNGKFRTASNKYGYINTNGKIILNPIYDNALTFSHGVTCVKEYNYWRVIKKNGIPLIEEKYNECKYVENGYIYLRKKTDYLKWTNIVMDNTGNILLDVAGNDIAVLKDGYVIIYETNLYSRGGKVEVKGPSIRKGDLVEWGTTRDGTVYRRNLGEADFFEPGKVIDKSFWSLTPNGRNAYYINMRGEKIGSKKYFDAKPFSEGVAAIRLSAESNSWGYINYNGKIVIEPKYDYAGNFISGLAHVILEGKDAYINKNGNVVWGLNN